MAGNFDDTVFSRGRPLTEIPPDLVKILDTTLHENKDYVVTGEEGDEDVDDIMRYGRIYANRKGLSFRCVFTSDGKFRFRLKEKRPYNKRDQGFWSSL